MVELTLKDVIAVLLVLARRICPCTSDKDGTIPSGSFPDRDAAGEFVNPTSPPLRPLCVVWPMPGYFPRRGYAKDGGDVR